MDLLSSIYPYSDIINMVCSWVDMFSLLGLPSVGILMCYLVLFLFERIWLNFWTQWTEINYFFIGNVYWVWTASLTIHYLSISYYYFFIYMNSSPKTFTQYPILMHTIIVFYGVLGIWKERVHKDHIS